MRNRQGKRKRQGKRYSRGKADALVSRYGGVQAAAEAAGVSPNTIRSARNGERLWGPTREKLDAALTAPDTEPPPGKRPAPPAVHDVQPGDVVRTRSSNSNKPLQRVVEAHDVYLRTVYLEGGSKGREARVFRDVFEAKWEIIERPSDKPDEPWADEPDDHLALIAKGIEDIKALSLRSGLDRLHAKVDAVSDQFAEGVDLREVLKRLETIDDRIDGMARCVFNVLDLVRNLAEQLGGTS